MITSSKGCYFYTFQLYTLLKGFPRIPSRGNLQKCIKFECIKITALKFTPQKFKSQLSNHNFSTEMKTKHRSTTLRRFVQTGPAVRYVLLENTLSSGACCTRNPYSVNFFHLFPQNTLCKCCNCLSTWFWHNSKTISKR